LFFWYGASIANIGPIVEPKTESLSDSRTLGPVARMKSLRGQEIPVQLKEIVSFRTQQMVVVSQSLRHEMYVVPIDSSPPMVLAVPDITSEGVGIDLARNGILEEPTFRVFQYLLEEKCATEDHLVVDLGANFGVFTTYSAVLGCRVIAVEAQPRLVDIVKLSLKLNGVQQKVDFLNNIVHSDKSAKLRIHYNLKTCWACSYVEFAKDNQPDTEEQVTVAATTVNDIIKENVLLLKIDIEGFEINALKGAKEAIEKYNVENILIEWNPGLNSHSGTKIEDAVDMLHYLHSQGYICRHYNLRMHFPTEGLRVEDYPIMGPTWIIPPEKFQEFNNDVFFAPPHGNHEANLWFSKTKDF